MTFKTNLKAFLGAPVLFSYTAMSSIVHAQTTGGGTVDPAAPLSILESAAKKAKSSTIQSDKLSSTLGGYGNVIVLIGGLTGLGLALWSGIKLYKASQDEQSRESVGGSIAGLVIGSLITVIAIIVTFISGSVFNGGTA